VLVLASAPTDQFVAAAPGWLFDRAPEHARVDPENPEILVPHLRCAAYELPLRDAEPLLPARPEDQRELIEHLAAAGRLWRDGDRWVAVGAAFPADEVDLRGPLEENFTVLEERPGLADGRVLAEVDFDDAPLYLHPGAIYSVEGRTWEVRSLDWEARKARVRAVEARYYTEAVCRTRMRVVHVIDPGPPRPHADEAQGTAHGVCVVHLVRAVPGFKKVRFGTHETLGYGPVELPDLELHTVALRVRPPEAVLASLPDAESRANVALAAAHVLRHVAALSLMCDPADLGHAVASDRDPGGAGFFPILSGAGVPSEEARLEAAGTPCLVLYDRQPGGSGLAAAAARHLRALLERAVEVVEGCGCGRGCPTCLGPGLVVAEAGGALRPALAGFLAGLARGCP
jgi:DEAD/DEAH box helicase domain-containing protein